MPAAFTGTSELIGGTPNPLTKFPGLHPCTSARTYDLEPIILLHRWGHSDYLICTGGGLWPLAQGELKGAMHYEGGGSRVRTLIAAFFKDDEIHWLAL